MDGFPNAAMYPTTISAWLEQVDLGMEWVVAIVVSGGLFCGSRMGACRITGGVGRAIGTISRRRVTSRDKCTSSCCVVANVYTELFVWLCGSGVVAKGW